MLPITETCSQARVYINSSGFFTFLSTGIGYFRPVAIGPNPSKLAPPSCCDSRRACDSRHGVKSVFPRSFIMNAAKRIGIVHGKNLKLAMHQMEGKLQPFLRYLAPRNEHAPEMKYHAARQFSGQSSAALKSSGSAGLHETRRMCPSVARQGAPSFSRSSRRTGRA